MKTIIAMFLAAFCVAAHPQTCGNTIKLLFVFSDAALTYLQNQSSPQTMAQFATAQVAMTNTTLSNSKALARVDVVGVRSGLCCQGMSQLFYAGGSDIGAVRWAQNNIPIMEARDATGADLVVLVTNFGNGEPAIDVPGYSATSCAPGSEPRNAKLGVVGINVAYLQSEPHVVGHEIAHQLCMQHGPASNFYARYRYSTGTNQSNCTIFWTEEAGSRVNGDDLIPQTTTTTTACWKYGAQMPCSSSGHQAIVDWLATPPNAPWAPYTYSQGHYQNNGTEWWEIFASASQNSGGQGIATFYGNTTSTVTTYFQCPGAQKIPFFSNSNAYFAGQALAQAGDAGSVATMDANTPDVACYHNTKIAPMLKAAVGVATGASR